MEIREVLAFVEKSGVTTNDALFFLIGLGDESLIQEVNSLMRRRSESDLKKLLVFLEDLPKTQKNQPIMDVIHEVFNLLDLIDKPRVSLMVLELEGVDQELHDILENIKMGVSTEILVEYEQTANQILTKIPENKSPICQSIREKAFLIKKEIEKSTHSLLGEAVKVKSQEISEAEPSFIERGSPTTVLGLEEVFLSPQVSMQETLANFFTPGFCGCFTDILIKNRDIINWEIQELPEKYALEGATLSYRMELKEALNMPISHWISSDKFQELLGVNKMNWLEKTALNVFLGSTSLTVELPKELDVCISSSGVLSFPREAVIVRSSVSMPNIGNSFRIIKLSENRDNLNKVTVFIRGETGEEKFREISWSSSSVKN